MSNLITVKNLCSEHHNNLNWNLKKNEIHGIIGPSGEGKSYFLKILLGLFNYNSGEILNKNNQKWEIEKESIGVQFQSSGLLNNLTIGQNIMLPLIMKLNIEEKYAAIIAKKYMDKVGLSNKIFYYYPMECSGGMQKRAALARALILEPEILFLDEPTAGIDCMMIETYDHLLKSLDIAIVLVTHELSRLAVLANRISILADKSFYTGSFLELKENDNIKVRAFLSSYARTNPSI